MVYIDGDMKGYNGASCLLAFSLARGGRSSLGALGGNESDDLDPLALGALGHLIYYGAQATLDPSLQE